MAPSTPGPANTITRPMTAMIRTYSMIPWPPEADTSRRYPPPGGSAPLHAYATLPSLRMNRNELSVGLSRESVFVLPLRHLGYCHALGRITPGTFLSESLCSVFGLMFQSEQSRWRLRRRSDIPVKSYTALKSHLAPRPVTSTFASGTNRSGIPFQNVCVSP